MDIHESITELLDSELSFGESFYGTFLDRFPQVRVYFQGVNMNRQAVLLTMSLLVIEQYQATRFPAMSRYLRELGSRHEEWGIPPETYPFFREALLSSLADFHGDSWDDGLSRQWSEAVDCTIEQMLNGYGAASSDPPAEK